MGFNSAFKGLIVIGMNTRYLVFQSCVGRTNDSHIKMAQYDQNMY